MAKNDNLTDFLTDVANAIRAKKGISGKINPQNFSSEIASISTGSGGGDAPAPSPSEPLFPVIGDGKTYLYIRIAEKGRMTVPLYFSQTIANGVTIDWGDGSASQSLSGTGNRNTTHVYAVPGDYVISLSPVDGCTLGLGRDSSSYCVLGSTSNNGLVYCNMLQGVEIGDNVASISAYAFYKCYSLASVVIPEGVTSIGTYAFYYCYSLASVVIPESVTSIGSSAFYNCYGMAIYDFSQCLSVPTLAATNAFSNIASDCKMVIPDALFDEWSTATNWSTYASKMVKASEFNG